MARKVISPELRVLYNEIAAINQEIATIEWGEYPVKPGATAKELVAEAQKFQSAIELLKAEALRDAARAELEAIVLARAADLARLEQEREARQIARRPAPPTPT